jgi:hypothetical protein
VNPSARHTLHIEFSNVQKIRGMEKNEKGRNEAMEEKKPKSTNESK